MLSLHRLPLSPPPSLVTIASPFPAVKMGIQELQRYIEVHAPEACVPVDLLKLARGVTLRQPRTPAARMRPPPHVQLCLVLDAESCLDRLYGGFFSGTWLQRIADHST